MHTEKVDYPREVPPYPMHGVLETLKVRPASRKHPFPRIKLSYLYSDTCYSHSAILAQKGYEGRHSAGEMNIDGLYRTVGANVEWRHPNVATIHQWVGVTGERKDMASEPHLLYARAVLLLATARIALEAQGFKPDEAGIVSTTNYWCTSAPRAQEEIAVTDYHQLYMQLLPDLAIKP